MANLKRLEHLHLEFTLDIDSVTGEFESRSQSRGGSKVEEPQGAA